MTIDTRVPSISVETDAPEWAATLQPLRARYRESRDLFSPRETAHLHFLRWLVRTGRLAL
jgi:hypothetical protein